MGVRLAAAGGRDRGGIGDGRPGEALAHSRHVDRLGNGHRRDHILRSLWRDRWRHIHPGDGAHPDHPGGVGCILDAP